MATSLVRDRIPLRIVLLGKSVSENSQVGNFILGRAAFDSEAPPNVVERVTGRLKNRHVIIINSPQLLQTNISDHQITQTVRECVYLSDPGPHVLVLLLKHKQCSTEDQECVEKVLHSLSEQVFPHTMVLSTQEPTETNEIIQKIIQKCFNRHFSLQRSSSSDHLLQMFEDIVQMNDGRHLVCEQQAIEKSVIHDDDDLRIVLLGKIGVGKSATGNTILRRKAFKSILTSCSVTRECQKETSEFNRRRITVINTPGLFDTGVDHVETRKEIVKCISMAAPGPHVFLLVIQLGRFTQEEKDAVKMIQEMFGDQSTMYTMVLFTRGDQLGERRIEDFIERDGSLKNITKQFGKRYHVFNNKETKDQTQVSELLEKIDRMLAVNGGSFYTNEMFLQVEKNIKEEQERIMKEKEEEIKRREEELKAKYEDEIEKMKEENERERQEKQNELRKRDEDFKKREEDIKKETDENVRKELQRKLEEQQKLFEECNKRQQKALEEQQQNFIKYLEEEHEKEKQELQERIHHETRQQAQHEYLIKLEKEVARALKEAEATVPYRSKRARDWSYYAPVVGGVVGGVIGFLEDIAYWIVRLLYPQHQAQNQTERCTVKKNP